jgi:fused signal recognition particle receptor
MFSFIKSKVKKVSSAIYKAKFSIGKKITEIFSKSIDESSYEELEKLFYESDLGVEISLKLVEKVKSLIRKNSKISSEELIEEIRKELQEILISPPVQEDIEMTSPYVILIVGVNGSGKTTSIAKLANYYRNEGKKVLIAAADTFRSAAVEQLEVWANMIGVDIIKSQHGSDPSAVVYDAITAAKARGCDIVLIDTAGRLHTKTDLMHELKKIKNVSKKIIENAPHETLLTLDATIGQNAIDQAEVFNKYTSIDGIILSKFDGTAKGGIVISVKKKLNIPIKWIGIGEQETDLEPFDSNNFLDQLLSF